MGEGGGVRIVKFSVVGCVCVRVTCGVALTKKIMKTIFLSFECMGVFMFTFFKIAKEDRYEIRE